MTTLDPSGYKVKTHEEFDCPNCSLPRQAGHVVLDNIARRLLHKQLAQLCEGELALVDHETQRFGTVNAGFPLSVTIEVREPGFYSDVVFGGSVGAAEAYMAGLWSCSDLTSLVRILLRNRHVLDGMDGGYSLDCGTAAEIDPCLEPEHEKRQPPQHRRPL